MGKFFPKLSQTHVWIDTDEAGNGFNCPMLPVDALGEMHGCSEALGNAKSVTELEIVRKRMVELIKTVMPKQYCDNLHRLDFNKLTELIAYLMYGDNDDLPREEKAQEPKKN